VHEIDPLSDSRWEAFVNDHPQASVFHSKPWLKALRLAYGYDSIVLTTCSRETALTNGLVFCRVKSWLTGRRLVSLPFADHCEPLTNNSAELDDLLSHVSHASQRDAGKWKYIEIRPTSYQFESRNGFRKSATYLVHSLDLRKSKQELFNNLHKSSLQSKIRRAEREALHYEEGNSEGMLNKFYGLMIATRRRHYLPPQPRSWFHALIHTFGDRLKIRVVSKDGLPIASIITLSHKKSMVYKYGCSDVRFHRFGGMALLLWNAIQEAKDMGAEELDMGRSDCDNLGLISFKERFGAVGKPLFYWTHSTRPRATLDVQEKALLHRLVPMTPDFVLEMAGKLLYRHMG
jgi:lipid II:glycine glycyltransferase (peptidoglycan interpeptide bridge formation enzyme)